MEDIQMVGLNPWNVDMLTRMEKESEQRIWNLLQLRLHLSIIALKKKVDNGLKDEVNIVDLTYLTAPGHRYLEFSGGYTDLYTQTYQQVIEGNGYGIDDPRISIEILNSTRNGKAIGIKGNYHSLIK